jgi:branched-subunit amino acid permease
MSHQERHPPSNGRDIAIHIFTASAALVGVCLTVISIVSRITVGSFFHRMEDDLLAFDAMVFLASCLLSYGALRVQERRRLRHLETAADIVFIIGLCGLVLACGLIVWTVV